jgi:uncharacterized protein DUF4058
MKSPFPGMDPYLEVEWSSVHIRLIAYAGDLLKPLLPDELVVRVDQAIGVQLEDSTNYRDYRPDVYIREAGRRVRGRRGNGGTALAEPIRLPLRQEPRVRRRLKIIDKSSQNRVVTAIEFLSPWNKLGQEARRDYRKKRRDFIRAKVNFVEVDLHRTGPYTLLARPNTLPPVEGTAYRACVWRAAKPLGVDYYVLPLRNRLSRIRIPLRQTDADVPLDLQTVIDEVYERGFAGEIDYTADPIPPLPPADAAWADKLLRSKGLR